MCLDFANTVAYRGSAAPSESLHSFAELLKWCGEAGAIPARLVEELRGWQERHPKRAIDTFDESIALREVIYRIFHAIAARTNPDQADLDLLNRGIRNAPPRSQIQRIEEGTSRNRKLRPLRSSRRCCGQREICWWGRNWQSCASARTKSASGFFSTIAKTARAVGVRCRRAVIAPRPTGTISVRSKLDVSLGQFDCARTRPRMHDGVKRACRRSPIELRVVIFFETVQHGRRV
jgi:Putative stress-induced transcription regulator